MIEKLVILSGSNWKELDLLKPSGITIKFESPIIKGYDSLTSDKTYSFEIPLTSKNVEAFGLVADIRIEDNFSAKYECKYSIDGISPKGKSFLYLSGKDGSLKANITFNIFDELVRIKEDDKSLRELDIKIEDDLEYKINEQTIAPYPLGQTVGFIGFDIDTDSSSLDYKYNHVDSDFEENWNNQEEYEPDIPDYDEQDGPDYDYPE